MGSNLAPVRSMAFGRMAAIGATSPLARLSAKDRNPPTAVVRWRLALPAPCGGRITRRRQPGHQIVSQHAGPIAER